MQTLEAMLDEMCLNGATPRAAIPVDKNFIANVSGSRLEARGNKMVAD